MSEILVVSGHTDLENSFANKIILGELKKALEHADKLARYQSNLKEKDVYRYYQFKNRSHTKREG